MEELPLTDACLLERHRECFRSRRCGCECHSQRLKEYDEAVKSGLLDIDRKLTIETYVSKRSHSNSHSSTLQRSSKAKKPKSRPVSGKSTVVKLPRKNVKRGVQVSDEVKEAVKRDLSKGVPMKEAARRNGCTYEQVRALKREMGQLIPVDADREIANIWKLRWQICRQALESVNEGEQVSIERVLAHDEHLQDLMDEFRARFL